MNHDIHIARMILEGDAVRLAALPLRVFDEAKAEGMDENLVNAMKAAHEAFRTIAREDAVETLSLRILSDVADGLAALDVKKRWWARVSGDGSYGRWVPTGCADRDEAADYLRTYPWQPPAVEWLLL